MCIEPLGKSDRFAGLINSHLQGEVGSQRGQGVQPQQSHSPRMPL
jgi:hypothetical protein